MTIISKSQAQRIFLIFSMATMSLVGGQGVANNRTYTLEKRAGLNFLGALGGDTGFGGGAKSLKDPCGYIELSPDNWQALGIDEYLAHYPNGDKLTLQEFAAELNVPNFYCGVGMQCSAGQLCSPAVGINWMILYAIQQWNSFMNSLYNAIEYAVTLVKDAASSIVSDFTSIIPPQDQLYGWTVADVVCGVLASISGIAVPAFVPADAVQVAMAEMAVATSFRVTPEMGLGKKEGSPREGQEAYDAARAALDARNMHAFEDIETEHDDASIARGLPAGQRPTFLATDGGSTSPRTHPQAPAQEYLVESPAESPRSVGTTRGYFSESQPSPPRGDDHHSEIHSQPPSPRPDNHPPETHRRERRSIIKHKEGHFSTYAYTRYAYLESRLSSVQNRIQSYVAVNFKMATMAPMLAQGGLAEILKGGAYLNPNPTEYELQEGGKALAQITVLAQLFQSLKIFVAIGSDECNAGGPNGAWNKKDELSYCTPDGLMMNLILASPTGPIIAMPNAHLLKEKYGYTTEFLARSAWECQKKYGIYTESNAPPPVNMRSDCIFPIAVCDCTLPDVAAIFKGKRKNLLEACRKGANLPI
ncbi:hypothetical protein PCASD_07320 [Puccinia coronata f. sp. avenae]|uniref:DUF7872 domain-containing protein n=1 Tax=Puccinia coronata f. sp. avenae TaxID=200324 RepID=A0A2N5URK2_9BASI|nr:hypothetical protein PCASD_07320 [Puccinia coronata f. sp. avenae]